MVTLSSSKLLRKLGFVKKTSKARIVERRRSLKARSQRKKKEIEISILRADQS